MYCSVIKPNTEKTKRSRRKWQLNETISILVNVLSLALKKLFPVSSKTGQTNSLCDPVVVCYLATRWQSALRFPTFAWTSQFFLSSLKLTYRIYIAENEIKGEYVGSALCPWGRAESNLTVSSVCVSSPSW